jgi:hypothetical protein
MRNSLGKAVAEVAERRNDEDDNENESNRDGFASCCFTAPPALDQSSTYWRTPRQTILVARHTVSDSGWGCCKPALVGLPRAAVPGLPVPVRARVGCKAATPVGLSVGALCAGGWQRLKRLKLIWDTYVTDYYLLLPVLKLKGDGTRL